MKCNERDDCEYLTRTIKKEGNTRLSACNHFKSYIDRDVKFYNVNKFIFKYVEIKNQYNII